MSVAEYRHGIGIELMTLSFSEDGPGLALSAAVDCDKSITPKMKSSGRHGSL